MAGPGDPGDVELVTRPTSSTQFYLFNLFGDCILPQGDRLWTNDLLFLLDLLGVGERAARTTLSRMKQQGWFETRRAGRQSQYVLTPRGQAILAEGDRRIFEEPLRHWDERWRLVVYSLPEEKRKLRNAFRKKLVWLGFGNLVPGTWVSPHDRQAELGAITRALNIAAHVTLLTADTADSEDIVARCWDIPALEADYRRFQARYQGPFEALAAGRSRLSPEECFVRRFWLTYNYQRFPLQDPNLPAGLLPQRWAGHEAWRLFIDYRRLLGRGMGDFVERLVRRPAPPD